MTRTAPLLVRTMMALLAALAVLAPRATRAEEIWKYDNSRLYGLVQGVTKQGELEVLLPTGKIEKVKLEEIIAIRFLGRNPLLVQSGTQEFRFVNGGWIRGQILQNDGDLIQVRTAMAGEIHVNFSRLAGFVALPLAGFSGRKAEELVDSPPDPRRSRYLDVVLDRRGSLYPGVIRRLERTQVHLYHEELVRIVPIKVLYVAGVRMADAARDKKIPWKGDVQMRFWGRDGSMVQGKLDRIHLGKWEVRPVWNPKKVLRLDLDEISLIQIMGGRVQYLSQLTPVTVEEQTILAPPQPYQMDRSCQGDAISIAGKRYPWGVGVHADSELTFELNKRFKEFRSAVGIATRMGNRGSVVFSVIGINGKNGKELYKSPVVRGSDPKPHEIKVSVAGYERLKLKVTNAGDLDLGDVANWGSARVIR
jgi:hypothetical protein